MSVQNNQIVNDVKPSKPIEHDDFNPMTVLLSGSNLIEASAGTGKTYSIAILALRLLLEKNIPIDKILMVTFTRDAAAEMELRVRNFIREGLQILRMIGEGSQDFKDMDEQIVKMLKASPDLSESEKRLQNALIQFDKAAIFTIHGFCSRILAEYAFESGQLFHAKTLEPSEFDQFVQDAFNQAWREQITVLDENLLAVLLDSGFNRKRVFDLMNSAINGKKIYLSDKQTGETVRQYKDRLVNEFNNLKQPEDKSEELLQELKDVIASILTEIETNRTNWINEAINHKSKDVQKRLPDIIKLEDESILLNAIVEKSGTNYFKDFFPLNFQNQISNYKRLVLAINNEPEKFKAYTNNINSIINQLISVLSYLVYNDVENQLKKIKENEGQVTFDDLIENLHHVICNEDPELIQQSQRLIKVLQERYSSVFIDEFQDTDELQFEIFFKVFNDCNETLKHILFFIGDPKQSIYAFRKADLQTYFKAAKLVDDVWRMNTNFRSTKNYIEAMNDFFQPVPDFNVFKSDQMKYYPVVAPPKARVGSLIYNDKPLNPLRIICCSVKADILNKTVYLVRKLLQDKSFKISKDNAVDSIKASQIGILVRNKREGKQLREKLSSFGITAITVSDAKVFESAEAMEIWYVLKAVEDISTGNINRALLTKISGKSWSDLTKLDTEKTTQKFREYQEVWKKAGVYKMLRQYISDSGIINRKISKQLENADRFLANTFQLMEMLHEAETNQKYAPDELLFWLKKGIDGEKSSEDGYLQRIESDESAIKIVTMHSCKGLEYDIVIAPYLDMSSINSFKSTQFRDEDGYYIAEKSLLQSNYKELAKLQTDQENLRLLYVAITRARYHCYLMSGQCHSTKGYNSSLKYLKNELIKSPKDIDNIKLLGTDEVIDKYKNSKLFEDEAPEIVYSGLSGLGLVETPIEKFANIPSIQIIDRSWQKTSYSRLNPKHDYVSSPYSECGTDPYDQFIFREMRKGAQTGNLLHDVLERIDFSQSNNWSKTITSSINRYPGTGINNENSTQIEKMLQIITSTILPESQISLNTVTRSQRISELEFDLPIDQVDWATFPAQLENSSIPIRINRENPLSGILNGKIDLFFEKDNRYYLLDWKSNHLGSKAEEYNIEALKNSMEENNYYLQYYFYCLALYRYLRLRIPGFDYEKQFGGVYYLFLRGMRQDKDYGIYFHKPSLKDLLLLEKVFLKSVDLV